VIEPATFALFAAATLVLAATPGPALLYVAGRTLAGGRAEGLASAAGAALGGCAHIAAGALGLSAIVAASADAFTALKLVGAAYLVWVGVQAWRSGEQPDAAPAPAATGARRAFRDGVLVELLNPKTALFFLAFLPQFVDPARPVAPQFALLGLFVVLANGGSDLVAVFAAARLRTRLAASRARQLLVRRTSGALFVGLGLSLALARRPT
jgi:threonine/homoserine/homoserine lactone efflux protein